MCVVANSVLNTRVLSNLSQDTTKSDAYSPLLLPTHLL